MTDENLSTGEPENTAGANSRPALPPEYVRSPASPRALLALAVLALLAALGALAWSFFLQSRLFAVEAELRRQQQRNDTVEHLLASSDARLQAMSDGIGQQIGLSKQEMEERSDAILMRQMAETARLESVQKKAEKRIGAVSTDVSTVKTEVASTRSDLADTKVQLQRTMGDAGVMSGLIARNHDELQTLKHRGDRTYYEFTLHKGDKPVLFAGIKLQLKKLNEKHARYTLLVSADDREIEKKDRTVDEPVQFYTGKDPVLYEVVVNEIGKNVISGYLSTPKGM